VSVSSKNGTDNNGINGKVGKHGTFSILGLNVWNGGWGLGRLDTSVPLLPTLPFMPLLSVPF